jgi:hypothetical protein
VNGLEVHRGLAAAGLRHAAHHVRDELGQVEGGREHVQVGLVEPVEGEDDDGDTLAGVAAVPQRLGVVGAQQGVGGQALVGHLQRQHRRPGLPVRGVTEDAAQFGDLAAQRGRDRGLLRGGVEDLAAHAAVVVHVDVERAGHRGRLTLDDRPGVPGAPAHRQALLPGPSHQQRGLRRTLQRGGQLDVLGVRRPEIGRTGQQRRVRAADLFRFGRGRERTQVSGQ